MGKANAPAGGPISQWWGRNMSPLISRNTPTDPVLGDGPTRTPNKVPIEVPNPIRPLPGDYPNPRKPSGGGFFGYM